MINITLTVTPEVAKRIIDMVSPVPATSQQGIAPNPAFEAALPAVSTQPTTQVPAVPGTEQPVGQASAPATNGLPTTEQTYTQEQLSLAAAQIMDAGRQAELVQLLANFGVQAVTQLPPTQYGAFATSLRGMGARI